MSLLAFRGVSKRFADGGEQVTVLNNVSFEVEAGETVGLFITRRGGKTTLLKIAAGLMPPDEGSVLWGGVDIVQMSRDESALVRSEGGIAYVRCDWRTNCSMSVPEWISIPLYTGPLTTGSAEDLASKTLELLGAPQLARRLTSELGMSERLVVELARAVVRNPRLILVDEPAVLRNPDRAREFYELLRSLPKKLDCALLIASEEVAPLSGCKPMMSLSGGRLISTTSRRKVIDFPVSEKSA
ncbi:MAG: ATP-binding cassette domain-containing protein [Solirubrobacteraceae bacterium]